MKLSKYCKTGRYTKTEIAGIKRFAKTRVKYLKKHFIRTNPKKILELGCGEGSLGYRIKEILGNAEIYGLDISAGALKLAKEKGLIVKRADLNEGIPYDSQEFDLVFSNQVIEHIDNTDLFIKESFRVLKKGGYFIVITPNLSFWLNRIIFLFGIYPIFLEASTIDKTIGMGFLKKSISEKEPVGHKRVFNLPALLDMIRLYGFKIEKIEGLMFPFKMPKILEFFYNTLDFIFAKKASLARDIMVIARKQ